mgnify:CR=1 FL=1
MQEFGDSNTIIIRLQNENNTDSVTTINKVKNLINDKVNEFRLELLNTQNSENLTSQQKSDLRDASKEELDSLASLLNNDWPNVVIELRSHTDLRGSDTLNARLSFDRALSCVNYLAEKGVDPQRLVPVGMADTEPVVLDNDESGLPSGVLSEEYILQLKNEKLRNIAHQKNRRTDFKVLSDDVEKWLRDNPNIKGDKKVIKNAIIEDDGKVIPIKKETGNFIQQID